MKNSRLIELLKTFSGEELKSFGKFLESPFLKPPRNTIVFFNYLIKFYPDYDSDGLNKETVFEKLFPKQPYNEKKLINLMFDLTKAAEDFLAYITLKKDEIEYLLSLSRGYVDKKLSKHSMKVNKIIEKKLVPGFSISKDYFSKFRRLIHLKSAYYSEYNDFENLIESKQNSFEASSLQFLIDYSEFLTVKISAKITYGKDLGNPFTQSIIDCLDMEKLIKLLGQNDSPQSSLIALHYYLLKIRMEPDVTDHFYKFRDLFYNNIQGLDREERSEMFNFLANYCAQKFTQEFIKEGLGVYKKMLEHDAYSNSENEYMQPLMYRNIVQFCLTLKEGDWLEIFIEKYDNVLNPDYKHAMKNLSYAYLYFMRKDFEKALVSISKINNEFSLFKTDVRNLTLKIYYELGHIEQAYSLIDSYKHFLSETKEVSEANKKVFRNYIKYFLLLLKIKSGVSREKPLFIKSNIERENNLVNKKWLMEKADELDK